LLLQSAGQLLNCATGKLPTQPLESLLPALAQAAPQWEAYLGGDRWPLLVGSWVPLSNRQLQELLLGAGLLGVSCR